MENVADIGAVSAKLGAGGFNILDDEEGSLN